MSSLRLLFLGLTLALCACAHRDASSPAPTTQAPTPASALVASQAGFEFHSGFWLNLHQRLLYAMGPEPLEEARPLEPGEALTSPVWLEAVAAYRAEFGQRDTQFDPELSQVNQRLAELESAADLSQSGLRPEVVAILERAASVYRARWAEEDRANRAWIQQLLPLLEQHGPAIAKRLGQLYGAGWYDVPVRVDVATRAGFFGAYTTRGPTHVTLSSTAKGNQGPAALELVFHEASHGPPLAPLMEAWVNAIKKANVKLPRDLGHALMFYTVGHTVQAELGPSYEPYARHNGLYRRMRAWTVFERILDSEWKPFLEGKVTSRDEVLSRIVEELPAALEAAGVRPPGDGPTPPPGGPPASKGG